MAKSKEPVTAVISSPQTKVQRRDRLGNPLTLDVPDAGWKYFGLGRSASYEAAKMGTIPTIRVGKRLRVPITAMDRKLDEVT